MFTGIIEHRGRILKKSGDHFAQRGCLWQIEFPLAKELKIGESVSVSGVCHTVTRQETNFFEIFSSPETLVITNLGKVEVGGIVNLERAVRVGERLGGHLVYGHIDTTAKLMDIVSGTDSKIFSFELRANCSHYVIDKGSVTINGVSLTIYHKNLSSFQVMLIPHTLDNTNFKELKLGQLVNIEWDVVGKYLENFHLRTKG